MQDAEEKSRVRHAPGIRAFARVPLLCVCLGIAAGSAALTVGDLQVRSTLGQPFSGIVRIDPAAGEAIRRECFSQGPPSAAMPGVPVIEGLRFILETGAATSYIRVLGDTPVREPLAQVILQVRCPGLPTLTRAFSLLLDPASIAQMPPQILPMTTPASRASALPARTSERVSGDIKPGSRYVVRAGDSLSTIASRIDGRPAYSVWPLADLIEAANPQAFENGRRDRLVTGATLAIPSLDQLPSRASARRVGAVAAPGRAERNSASRSVQSGADSSRRAGARPDPASTIAETPADSASIPVLIGEPVGGTELEYLVLTPALSRLSLDRIGQRRAERANNVPEPEAAQETEDASATIPIPASDAVPAEAESTGTRAWPWLLGLILLMAAALLAVVYARRKAEGQAEPEQDSPWELEDEAEVPELPIVEEHGKTAAVVYDDFEGTFVSVEPHKDMPAGVIETGKSPDPENEVMTHLMPVVDDSGEHEQPDPRHGSVTPERGEDRRDDSGEINVTTLEETGSNINEDGWVELDFEATQILEQDYLAEYAAQLKDKIQQQKKEAADEDDDEPTLAALSGDDEPSQVEVSAGEEFDDTPLLLADELLLASEDSTADTLKLVDHKNDDEEEAPVVLEGPIDDELEGEITLAAEEQDDVNVVKLSGRKKSSDEPEQAPASNREERKKS